MHPWRELTVGIDLKLHAPLAATLDPAILQAEFAAADAATGPAERTFFAKDGSWSSITLIARTKTGQPGAPRPALDCMPSVQALLARTGLTVVGCAVNRQEPGGVLSWHFDNQALHLYEARLLMPILVPAGAETLIGHQSVAYPAGRMWTGDFAIPHQVENFTDTQRCVLLIDVLVNDIARRLAPPELYANAPLRHHLAEQSRNMLLSWRAENQNAAAA